MIPYPELAAALDRWRVRNGLPISASAPLRLTTPDERERLLQLERAADGYSQLREADVTVPDEPLLGEVLHYDPVVVGRYQQEHDFDTLFDFPLCGAVKGALVWDQPMTTIARPRLHRDEPRGILDRESPYTNANRLVTLLDNHDLDRRITSEMMQPRRIALLQLAFGEAFRIPELREMIRDTLPGQFFGLMAVVLGQARTHGLIHAEHLETATRMYIGSVISYVALGGILRAEPLPPPSTAELEHLVDAFLRSVEVRT